MLGAYAPLGSSAPSHTPTAASLLHCSAVRPQRCGQHVDATFSTPPWSTEAAETTSSAPSGLMRMASCAVARQRDVILIRAGTRNGRMVQTDDLLTLPSTGGRRRPASAVGTWTWEQAAWLSTRCTWLTQNHVLLDAPTTWPRSVPRKVAPQLTTTVGWPTAGDRQGPRVRAGLSLLFVRPVGPVAQTGWRPPGAPWSCYLNAAATSPGDLLRAGACAWLAPGG